MAAELRSWGGVSVAGVLEGIVGYELDELRIELGRWRIWRPRQWLRAAICQ